MAASGGDVSGTRKIIALLLAVACMAVMARSSTQPIPNHQSADGGRGMNPAARAESANGAGVQRSQ